MDKTRNFLFSLHKYTHPFFMMFGILCVIFYKTIADYITYFIGSITLFLGVIYFISAVCNLILRKYKLATTIISFILCVLATVILVYANKEIGILLTVILWIINGVIKFAMHLYFGIKQLTNKQKSGIYALIVATAIIAITTLLILHGPNGIEIHVLFFGVESFVSASIFLVGVKDSFSLWQLIDFGTQNK